MDATPLRPSVHFHIEAAPQGGLVALNGTDISGQLAGVQLEIGFGGPTVLHLHTRAGAGTIEGEGLVHVHGVPNGDTVRQIDPQLVRQLHSERGLGTVTDDPYAAMLAIVADLLDAAS